MNLKIYIFVLFLWIPLLSSCEKKDEYGTGSSLAANVETIKIWSRPGFHLAFTDLVEFQNAYYCTFREGVNHVGYSPSEYGLIRVIKSLNGTDWESVAELKDTDYDLRDPKISITPEGTLMLMFTGVKWNTNGSLREMKAFKSVLGYDPNITDKSNNTNQELTFQQKTIIEQSKEASPAWTWLWRVTWHDNVAYGIAYWGDSQSGKAFLMKSYDGTNYSVITELNIPTTNHTPANINEASIEFGPDGLMRVIGRSQKTDQGVYSESYPPYTEWATWKPLGVYLGGPLLKTINGRTYIGTRGNGTSLYLFDSKAMKLMPVAQSGMLGDTGYPGLIETKGQLWMSFYHASGINTEGEIYLMSITLSDDPNLRTQD